MWQSTNPALANDDIFQQVYGKGMLDTRANVATLQGVVNKTAILTGLAIAAGAAGYWALSTQAVTMGAAVICNLVGFVVVLGIYFVIHSKPQTAVYLAPVYAVIEGAFLGVFTLLAEYMLAAKGIKVPGGVALQAFLITGSVLAAMLALYSMRIIKPTPTFVSVISTATGAIMITYLLSFVLSLFGVNLPFISAFSAANDTGMAAWIGLGINVVILGIASMWLIIDFGMIEQRLRSEAPKYIEWYCGFALLVTLAWIYYESVKLVLRVASLLNRR
jgi:uncharacterized YccA/Bax inhibitor family protein